MDFPLLVDGLLMNKCPWAVASAIETNYHDHEWGVPVHDDALLFEMLTLEGAQAGLSWSTILNKREGYRNCFDHFNVGKIANYTNQKIASLYANDAIVRNKLKINSTIHNARSFLKIQQDFGSFDTFIWQFVEGSPIQNQWRQQSEVPAQTETSIKMSKELKQRGFKFVGPTICYAFMQAIGMVNDHLTDCYRHQQLST